MNYHKAMKMILLIRGQTMFQLADQITFSKRHLEYVLDGKRNGSPEFKREIEEALNIRFSLLERLAKNLHQYDEDPYEKQTESFMELAQILNEIKESIRQEQINN